MRKLTIVLFGLALCTSCRRNDDTLTVSEAQQALEESSLSSQAETLLADGVEVSTSFTIGQAIENAAEELRAFIASQLPCAEITRDGATLQVQYGKLAGSCTYHGHVFAGSHTISVMRNEERDVLVHHEWEEFSNGKVSVSGTADVTWSRASKSRRVRHELTWTAVSGPNAGRMGVGSGDRTQTALDGDITVGVRIDGTRAWDGDVGRFELDIDGVEARWIDPVPQAGSYVLQTPWDKTLTLAFDRVDADTIAVTVSNGSRSFTFDVSALGQISRGAARQ